MDKSILTCNKCSHRHTEKDRTPAKGKAYIGQTACSVCGCVFSKVIEVQIM